jgi:integrase/recombinase XerC
MTASPSLSLLTLPELALMLREAVADGRWKDTRLGGYVGRYLDWLRYAEMAPNTLVAYEPVLALFCVEHADLAVADLEPPNGGLLVRDFLHRHWGKTSPATRRQRLAIMRSWLRWMVGEGILKGNPSANIRGPKERRFDRKPPSFDEIEALVASQHSLRDQAALMLLAFMGFRKDELRRVQFKDIDLLQKLILVHGKGGHEELLPLGYERVEAALRLHMLERQPKPDEYLLHPRGDQRRLMDPATIHRWFKDCLVWAGFSRDRWAPHDLRHAAGDALYSVTGDIVLAQQLLRHTDIRTTRRYMRPLMDRLSEAMRQQEVLQRKDGD